MRARGWLVIVLSALAVAAASGVPLALGEDQPEAVAPAAARPMPPAPRLPRLHPIDNEDWVFSGHLERYEAEPTSCQACHGPHLRGTSRSRTAEERRFELSSSASVVLSKATPVGCAICHAHPHDDQRR